MQVCTVFSLACRLLGSKMCLFGWNGSFNSFIVLRVELTHKNNHHHLSNNISMNFYNPGKQVPENVLRQLLMCVGGGKSSYKELKILPKFLQILWECVLGRALHLSAIFPLTHRASSSARILKSGSCPSSPRRFFFSSFSKHLNHKGSEAHWNEVKAASAFQKSV